MANSGTKLTIIHMNTYMSGQGAPMNAEQAEKTVEYTPTPRVEIITIGDEILIGQVVDTNSAWIGQELSMAGWQVGRIQSVGDEPEEILEALSLALSRAKLVILTGGLGPTRDDRTKSCLTDFLAANFKQIQRFYQKSRIGLPKGVRILVMPIVARQNCPTMLRFYITT